MYEILSGPLVWVAFLVFFGGAAYKLVRMFRLVRKEKVTFDYMDTRYGLRSILHWIIPFASKNMRVRPVMTVVAFLFHFCLLMTPLLLMGHNLMWFDAWGVRLPSLPDVVSDVMTLIVICGGMFFLSRRVASPVVSYVTDGSDYLILAIAVGPFVTGFLAAHGWFPYELMMTLHMITGIVWLIAIPISRLSHMFYFVFTRAYMGSEFGAVRNARDW